MNHPHDLKKGIPLLLPSEVISKLSVVSSTKVLMAVIAEWLGIVLAIALGVVTENVIVYLLMVVFIAARQHALAIIGHDAVHYRFLTNRTLNDWVANIFVTWPIFINVAGFRKVHGEHHRHLAEVKDGNRSLWNTHNKAGEINQAWVYPKTKFQLVSILIRHTVFLTGMFWVLRGFVGAIIIRDSWALLIMRMVYYATIAFVMMYFSLWWHYFLLWIVPYCTWHITIQYIRLISEHSAVQSNITGYELTRTTIPTWWESILILPRNIGYHIEHHWYPSVPFYNLPKLHEALKHDPGFAESANISTSVFSSLKQVVRKNNDSATVK